MNAITGQSKQLLRATAWLPLAIAMLVGAGCKSVSGPDYARPELPEKSAWVSDYDNQRKARAAIEREWWRGFGSPELNRLIDEAIVGDYDLKILALRIERAGVGIRERQDQALQRNISGDISEQFQKQRGQDSTRNRSFDLNASLNWEIDIWGKVEKSIEAAEAEYHASEADWRAGYLTLVSGVASKYFEILQFDDQLRNQAESLDTQMKLLRIYQAQHREGLVPESRLLSQQAEIATRERDRLEIERQRKAAVFDLATLLGKPAGSVTVEPGSLAAGIHLLTVPEGLPSDLLVRRPDIVAQEYRVLAAHNLLGEARLAKLPSFSLTASAGLASTVLSNLLKSWTLGLTPSIKIPIFDPSLDRRIENQSVDTRIAEETYRQTVLRAFEEVETALLNLEYRRRQKDALEEQIEHLKVVRDVQYAQLREGLVSQLEVFETDRSLLSAQQGLLTVKQQILSDTITLYKAMGGGWPAEYVAMRN